MAKIVRAFFAYPGRPIEVAQTIRTAITKHNQLRTDKNLEPWEINDISGVPITKPIFENISEALYVAADITFLNENVTFEVGYAIGQKKRCLLFRNSSMTGDKELADKVGIFETIGYEGYTNSDELAQLLTERSDFAGSPAQDFLGKLGAIEF